MTVAWRVCLPAESALRVAAASLCQATSSQVGATRVVCDCPESQQQEFALLVADISMKYCLEAEVRYRDGAAAVRFNRHMPSSPHFVLKVARECAADAESATHM